ncbi:ABC transporter substrate-binding protein [Hungatella hathewayi]|uniref:ABC transporter substrate-binding protein n=1 Tax=Hungatella hathewayi TaxID=154046 RepID=UPI0032193AC1
MSAIKAGNAPDLFPLPSGMKLSAALKENWFMPMNDYVSDDFLNSFADGALNEGITTIDGKTYVLPESANIINTLVFYNKNVLKEAGIDENQLPKTRSEFLDVCKKVSDAGNGRFFGIIDSGAQANRLELALRSLASLDGGKCSDISQMILVDGQNTLNSEAMQSAYEFYDTLVKEGCFHPDTVSIKAPEARALFAQNQAAFIIQGAWCISTWRKDNPDLDFGVMALPAPDDGMKGKLPYIGAQPWMGISANCKHPDVAARYLTELYSEDYQAGLVEDGGFVSVIDAANKAHMTDDVMLQYYNLNNEVAALAPDPIVGNPAAADVYAEVSAITPGLGEIAQGILAQNIDYKTELKTLSDKTQEEWMRAIDAAKAKGADVSADDFEFKNWNPMENYTADLYESR